MLQRSDLKSGTMITVGFALEQGKDVFAVPGRVYDSKGCNALIQQGAKTSYECRRYLRRIGSVSLLILTKMLTK